jgi:hypothetical protein
MNGTLDKNPSDIAEEGEFDPREAAALAQQTERQAQRDLDPAAPPWMAALLAGAVLVAFGALWLSVRGQHPYTGPSGWAGAVVAGDVILTIAAASFYFRRARAGVSGASSRRDVAIGATVLTTYVLMAAFQGALKKAGASHAIVYGIYPATAPLIAVGCVAAVVQVGRGDWPGFGAAIAVAVVACISSFAGPINVWLYMGIGLFLVIVGYAVATARLKRSR